MNGIVLAPAVPEDREEMAGIFNHYAEHSFATYTETPLSVEGFEQAMAFRDGWPAVTARTEGGVLVGFGLLRPYSTIPAFAVTAEFSCFIRQGYTGQGTGRAMLGALEEDARSIGLRSIIATACSLNDRSIRFHLACGFDERGRLAGIGTKRGRVFDVVLLQKILDPSP